MHIHIQSLVRKIYFCSYHEYVIFVLLTQYTPFFVSLACYVPDSQFAVPQRGSSLVL